MFDRIVYLNDNCPPRNQYVLTNCINLITEIYNGLRKEYHIPKYVDKEKNFDYYLKESEADDIYIQDLPEVSRTILKSCNGTDYPVFLRKRITKLKDFFEIE